MSGTDRILKLSEAPERNHSGPALRAELSPKAGLGAPVRVAFVTYLSPRGC